MNRYFDQDILVHELSHGVHKLAAILAVEGFQVYLQDLYDENVKKQGMWANTYAATNPNEYFVSN